MRKSRMNRSQMNMIEEKIITSFSNVIVGGESLSKKGTSAAYSTQWKIAIKRSMDLMFSGIFLMMSFPIILFIGIILKLTSKGPILFQQDRVGLHAEPFKIKKFRTMRHEDSEQEHKDYIKYLLKNGSHAANQGEMVTNYIDYVERKVTKMGRFLRATSLDELPQLINILVGQMSMVGPRPHPIYEVNEYKKWYRRRLEVKPGLTGWSKLNLRMTPNNYEEAILYDLWYVDNWSLSLDLKIIILTIPFLLIDKDAH